MATFEYYLSLEETPEKQRELVSQFPYFVYTFTTSITSIDRKSHDTYTGITEVYIDQFDIIQYRLTNLIRNNSSILVGMGQSPFKGLLMDLYNIKIYSDTPYFEAGFYTQEEMYQYCSDKNILLHLL